MLGQVSRVCCSKGLAIVFVTTVDVIPSPFLVLKSLQGNVGDSERGLLPQTCTDSGGLIGHRGSVYPSATPAASPALAEACWAFTVG